MSKTPKNEDKFDWSAFDAMTDEEIHAAAMADPDAQPITEESLAKMRLVPRTITMRRAEAQPGGVRRALEPLPWQE